MVKAEISINIKNDHLELSVDLLKREDWKEDEWGLANIIQQFIVSALDILKKNGIAEEIYGEIIREPNDSRK